MSYYYFIIPSNRIQPVLLNPDQFTEIYISEIQFDIMCRQKCGYYIVWIIESVVKYETALSYHKHARRYSFNAEN